MRFVGLSAVSLSAGDRYLGRGGGTDRRESLHPDKRYNIELYLQRPSRIWSIKQRQLQWPWS